MKRCALFFPTTLTLSKFSKFSLIKLMGMWHAEVDPLGATKKYRPDLSQAQERLSYRRGNPIRSRNSCEGS